MTRTAPSLPCSVLKGGMPADLRRVRCHAFVDHDWRTASPRGEEGQQYFAFLADEAEKLLRRPGLLSLQVDLTHDDRPDRRVLDLGVRLGHGECVHVEDDVLDRGRALFQGNEPCRFASCALWVIRRLSLSRP